MAMCLWVFRPSLKVSPRVTEIPHANVMLPLDGGVPLTISLEVAIFWFSTSEL